MKLNLVTGLMAAALVFTGCDKNKTEKPSESSSLFSAGFKWSAKTAENAEIKIFNHHGEPIANAQILIGDAQGNPFRENFLTTDRNGVATIPADWTTPASVTVHAPNYIRQTLLNQQPGNLTIHMNPAYLAQFAELKGNVTGLPVVDKDKLTDFALAMPLLKKSEMLNMDFSQIISPYSDKFSAAGNEMSVPSNVSLPKQKENYSIIGVTLNKPIYRLKVPTLGTKKYVATRGRFVFKKVVDELRGGKSFQDVINMFTIHGGGIAETTLAGPLTNLDIPGNSFEFSGQLQATPVSFQADELAMVLSTSELNGQMIPTDVKRVTAGKPTTLQTLPNQQAYIINILKKTADFSSGAPGSDRMTASALPYSAGAVYSLLPLISNPTITQGQNYVITLPEMQNVQGIHPVATTAFISDLSEVKEDQKIINVTNRKWEIIGFGWNSRISLPKWPLDQSTAKKRVEVKYIGSSTSNAPNTLEFATHVTHASADF